MDSNTVPTPEVRPNFSAIAIAAAMLLAAASEAHAIVNVGPPAGWTGGRVYVGREINGSMWAAYVTGYRRNDSGGACAGPGAIQIGANNVLGAGNLPGTDGERHRIHGGSGRDEMLLIGTGSVEACGKILIPFAGDPKIELWGNGGTDDIMAKVSHPSALIHGGLGDDSIVAGQIAQVRGSDGADWIVTAYPTQLHGEGGGDLLCSYSESLQSRPAVVDGGTGDTDQCWGLTGGCGVVVENVEYDAERSACDDARSYVESVFAD